MFTLWLFQGQWFCPWPNPGFGWRPDRSLWREDNVLVKGGRLTAGSNSSMNNKSIKTMITWMTLSQSSHLSQPCTEIRWTNCMFFSVSINMFSGISCLPNYQHVVWTSISSCLNTIIMSTLLDSEVLCCWAIRILRKQLLQYIHVLRNFVCEYFYFDQSSFMRMYDRWLHGLWLITHASIVFLLTWLL